MSIKLDLTILNDFKINNISNYLKDQKKILISLGILDKNEINKNLTSSLNNSLLPQKTFEEKYIEIISKLKEVETNIIEIKKQIEDFNKSQGFVSFVDIDDILYITYFNEISLVDRKIIKIKDYIEKDINLNYLYCYVITKFYDELTDSNKNYLFILEHRVNDYIKKPEKSIIDQKIIDFFSINKIKILKEVIKQIFNLDQIYKAIIKKLSDDKLSFLKQIYADNNILEETKEVLNFQPYMDIKKKFIDDRKIILKKKRDIVFDDNLMQQFFNKLFTEQITVTIEIWYGVILFITKHFNVSIDKLMDFFNKKLNPEFIIDKDIFNDLVTPMSKYVWITDKVGGNINFYKKYLKYKKKYLSIKKLQYGGKVTYF